MLHRLLVLVSMLCFVLSGATFTHAAEIHTHLSGHGPNVRGQESHGQQEARGEAVHGTPDCGGHACPHHHQHGSKKDGMGESSVHCGASILGIAPEHFRFGPRAGAIHEHVPAADFTGRLHVLDPPPPRLLSS
ncbi:hypothetical protein GGD81_003006 [Rhodobium orientis]|uniref:Uncharacterized protein n=1 Tax=Rhodobium orientis TaxID=34017 RepID=A0A327JSM9_9HYPH|nr:hypothetical protein [Rhodobium orientis]MBB4303951.1 hypothetical protein [Rhodobium orientis]MBK5950837.1 hypothetical protein [Rhodobium orientis]RAI29499.1 hypothetical protein CH339_02280 [Rhodobium orientis]